MRRNQGGFSASRLVFGLGVIAIGLLLTLDSLGRLEAEEYLRFWPALLIAIGLTKVFSRRLPDLVFAILLIGLGSWLLLNTFDVIDVEPWLYFWPIILLLIGGFLVAGALRSRGAPADSEDYVRGFALLSGFSRKSTSLDFKGADLTAVMGGCEVDLRQAEIASGIAEVEVFAFWGGVELKVPRDWHIEISVWPILGGFEDDTEQTIAPDSPRVRIKGAAIMGGVGIKN